MKTAISLPDGLFEEAERAAREMGLARSQLFALALEEFLEKHSKAEVTEALDRVYSALPLASLSSPEAEPGIQVLRELTRHDSW